jgi:hypothetical protein
VDHFVLVPGRHHLLTRFQADRLRGLAAAGSATVIWAVTSANHQNTGRNPVAFDRREAAIERFSVQEGLRSLVVPVFDTAPTDRFAEVTLNNVEVVLGRRLCPADTVVACSTPEVARMYARLGFPIDPVEAAHDPAPPRPWEVLLRLADGDRTWRALAHPATVDLFDRYRLDEHVRRVLRDPVVGDEGGLTTTRDYRGYVDAFDDSAPRKWDLVRRHVRPGRIVDIGCGAGSVLALADAEPALRESDLIGVDFHYPAPYRPGPERDRVELDLATAMDFLTHKDYANNWLSEMHEQFCGLEFADWKALLVDAGFEVDPASRTWRNEWIVANRIEPVASLSTVGGEPLAWPVTHVLTVARRPLNTSWI